METRELEYRDTAGKLYVGFLARPERPTGPSVLVAHAAPGLKDHEREIGRRLAGLGYVALCADYYGDGKTFALTDTNDRIGPLVADPSQVRGPMQAGLAALAAQPGVDAARIAVIGYCFGGAAAIELGRAGADVKAMAGFHAALPTNRPEDCKNIRGKVLVLNGADDPLVPPEQRNLFEAQMNAAGADWRMNLYGGAKHGFTMVGSEKLGRPGIGYDRATDERSWRAMLDLFEESIGRP